MKNRRGLSVRIASIVVGLVIWYFGKEYGPIGSGLANLSVIVGISLPVWTWVWYRLRAEWHRPPDPPPS